MIHVRPPAATRNENKPDSPTVKPNEGMEIDKMKELTVALATIFVASSVSAGLFDTITKSTGVNLSAKDNQQVRRERVSRMNRQNGTVQDAENTLDKMKAIDEEIDAMPSSTSILGYSFGSVSDVERTMDNNEVTEVQLSQSDKESMSSAFCECFSKVRIHRESDGSIGTIELVGEQKTLVNESSQSMYKTAMYKCLRYINHNFEVVPSDAVENFMKYNGYTIPPPRFRRKLSTNNHWSGEFDSNGPYYSLRITDLTAHKRVEEHARRAAEEKAAAHKAQMAEIERKKAERLEKERKEQAELARKREEENKREDELERKREMARQLEEQKRNEDGQRYKITQNRAHLADRLRLCRDGNDRTSVWLESTTVMDAKQFLDKPLLADRVPLYKSIVSGSTLLWTIGQFVDFKGRNKIGENVEVKAIGDVGLSGFDYDGIAVQLPDGESSTKEKFYVYCTSEGIDENVPDTDMDEQSRQADVEVFGIEKSFPDSYTVDEVMKSLKRKYSNLTTKENKSVSTLICLDYVGMKCVTTLTKYEARNDVVFGIIEESRFEFSEFDLKSNEADFLVYITAENILKHENNLLADKFEKSFRASAMQAKADMKNGKYKKELERFHLKAGSIDQPERDVTSDTLLVYNIAAKSALSDNSFLCRDAIKQARAELANAQSEFLNGGNKALLTRLPKVRMKLFDAKALDLLPKFKQKRIADKLRKEQEKKDAKKASALNF